MYRPFFDLIDPVDRIDGGRLHRTSDRPSRHGADSAVIWCGCRAARNQVIVADVKETV